MFCLQESLSVVYGVVGLYTTVRDVVSTHRSVTAASTSTRRPANCFNFLRQLQVLEKAGDETVATFTETRLQAVPIDKILTCLVAMYSHFGV